MIHRRAATVRFGIRLARREFWRRPWRSSLILLMVLVPTAIMTVGVTFLRTGEWSAAEHQAADAGRADATARPSSFAATDEQLGVLRGGIPAGSELLVERHLDDRVGLVDRSIFLTVSDLDLGNPITTGRFGPLHGRLPKDGGGVVVNDAAARLLGVEIGDTFTPDRLGRPVEVVGTVRTRSTDVNEAIVYVHPPLSDHPLVMTTVWIDLPGPARGHDPFSGSPRGIVAIPGWELVDQSGANDVDQTQGVFWTYLAGGVALIVVATIITAAFAIGARRQLRTIGLLSSSGASPATTQWFLVAEGVVIGALGSLAGVVVGLATAWRVPDKILYEFVDRPVDGIVIRPLDLVPIVLIGTFVAAIAAWLPARSASRASTLEALAGRAPVGVVPRRVPILGATSVGVGCAFLAASVAGTRHDGSSVWVLPGIVGGAVALLGAIAIAPWAIAGLERSSARWPDAWRLAGRSLGRSRVRSSAVVGAVCAVAASVVVGGTLSSSLTSDTSECCDIPTLARNQVLVEMPGQSGPVPETALARLRRVVPQAKQVVLPQLVPATDGAEGSETPPAFPPSVIVKDVVDGLPWLKLGPATPEMLDLFEAPAASRASIARGDAVGVVASSFGSDHVELQPGFGEPVRIPLGRSFTSPARSTQLPQVLLSPERAASLGFQTRPSWRVLLELPEPMSDRTRDAFEFVEEELRWRGAGGDTFEPLDLAVYLPPDDTFEVSPNAIRAGAVAFALFVVLAVVAVGLALAARDSEDERQVLSAVGAPPRTLRRIGALRGVLLTLTAAVIAVPAALLVSAAIVAVSDAENGFRIDWWAVLFVVAVVPLVVGVAALAGGRLRDAIRPPRPDAFAFSE